MHIAIFFAALAGALIAAITDRQLRPVALMFAVVMAALLAFVVWDELIRDQANPNEMTLDQLALTELAIEQDERFVRVSGRAENLSEGHRLREFRLLATLHDCPAAESAFTDCQVIAQDDGIARVDIPPGQVRAFSAVFSFRDVPELQGVPIWDYELTALRATTEQARTSPNVSPR
ncbi:MAG: hypothetical protein HUJ24_12410 [Rhodobacteraceae bacterium]|nr:hypothetical protein [Paracoccaceae bacterium]